MSAGQVASPTRDLSRLNDVRQEVEEHFLAGKPAEALGLDGYRPAKGLEFAFVGVVPKRTVSAEWYRCSFCQTDRKFSGGRVVLHEDQQLRLIGNSCWKDHIESEEYNRKRDEYRDYDIAKTFGAVRNNLYAEARNLSFQIRRFRHDSSSALPYLQGLPGIVLMDTPELHTALVRARQDGGVLQVEEQVPDINSDKDEQGRYTKFIRRQSAIHRVEGLEAVFGQKTMSRLATEVEGHLDVAIVELDKKTPDNPTQAASRAHSITRRLRQAAKALDQLGNEFAQARAFLSTRNTAGIVAWANHPGCHSAVAKRISATEVGMAVESDRRDPIVFAVPSSLRAIPVPSGSKLAGLIRRAG